MPADNGLGLTIIREERQADHNRDSQTPKQTVRTTDVQLVWFYLPLQHGQLMAQCDVLGLQSSLAPKAAEKGIEKQYEDVEDGRRRLTGPEAKSKLSFADEVFNRTLLARRGRGQRWALACRNAAGAWVTNPAGISSRARVF